MPIADLLAGAASFAAILGGLLGRSALRSVGMALSGFVLVFLYSAAMGSVFPMGIAHLVGAALLGLLGYLVQRGLFLETTGRLVVGGFLAACIISGVLVVQQSGERKPFRGLLTAIIDYQEERLVHAEAMVRGEIELIRLTEERALFDATFNAALNTFISKPYEYAGTLYVMPPTTPKLAT